jgi:hypothetical protein
MNMTGVHMTLPESQKVESSNDMDLLLRSSRRALVVVLFAILLLGATVVGMAFWPSSLLAEWPGRMPWLFPILMVFAVMALRASLGGRRWDSHSPEVRVMLHDEFRRANLSRAQRAALIAVLIAQAPLGLLFVHLPARQAVMGMAGTTITLGMAILITLFLFFDRG